MSADPTPTDAQQQTAVYLCISKSDGQQSEEPTPQARRVSIKEGYNLTHEFIDQESARTGRQGREALDRIYRAAESR